MSDPPVCVAVAIQTQLEPAGWNQQATHLHCLMHTADLPVIQQLLCKTCLLDIQQLRPAVAYVLVYELLFGQVYILQHASQHTAATGVFSQQPRIGCRDAELKEKQKKLCSVSRLVGTARLHAGGFECCSESHSSSICQSSFKSACLQVQAELQQGLQELLKEAAVEHVDELLSANIARGWHRTARVNLLKMTVAEALAWLRTPPALHKKWASLVSRLIRLLSRIEPLQQLNQQCEVAPSWQNCVLSCRVSRQR